MKRKEDPKGLRGTPSELQKENEEHFLYCRILLSLRQLNQRNPTREDMEYILKMIEGRSISLWWSSFPKELWCAVLKELMSLKDLHHCLQVCRCWKDILLSENFWEMYVSAQWNLDTSIKTPYTVPASKYAKLRLYLETYSNGHNIAACARVKQNREGDTTTDIASYDVLFSTNQLGFVCAYWYFDDYTDSEGEGPGSYYSCLAICNSYSGDWFGGSCNDLMVYKDVVSRYGKKWVEHPQFKEIRRMMGYKNWKKLIHKLVDLCLDENDDSVWDSGDEYCWKDFGECYNSFVGSCDTSSKAKGRKHVIQKVKSLEKLTGLTLLFKEKEET